MAIRRIALVFCIILLGIDAALLVWIKPYVKTMLGKVQVQVYVEKQELANNVKAKLEARGLQVKLEANVPQSRNVVKGFKVYFTQKDAELLKPVLDTLKHDHIQAKLVDNEIIAGVFPTEAKAQLAQKKLAKVGFQVGENIKVLEMKVFQVSCEVDGSEAVESVKTDLADVKGVRPDDIKLARPNTP